MRPSMPRNTSCVRQASSRAAREEVDEEDDEEDEEDEEEREEPAPVAMPTPGVNLQPGDALVGTEAIASPIGRALNRLHRLLN